nr:MAG TPA: Head Tail Connector Protein [Caudoviricetes sp.]
MVYASKEQYLSEHNTIPEEQIEKRLKQVSRHIDSLTFNRITSRGFDNLTEFQQAIIIDVCCDMADFEYENEDMINCVLQNYAVNGVSMQFGSSWNVLVQNGIAVKRDTYQVLCQTGFCCLSLGV